MEQKFSDLSLALMNAPQGIELWDDLYGPVIFDEIDSTKKYPIKCHLMMIPSELESYTNEGSTIFNNECHLWPDSESKTWYGFQKKIFKAGHFIKINNRQAIYLGEGNAVFENGEVVSMSDKEMLSSCLFSYNGFLKGFELILLNHGYMVIDGALKKVTTPEEAEKLWKEKYYKDIDGKEQ